MRLPPLNALRAFEAAARHDGYIAAAEELHVTRGAISRHVKILEEHLGVALFTRHAKGVSLTSAGRRLQATLQDAFAKIASEAERISSAAHDLRILCPPATSIRWLIPRLEGFRTLHPQINVSLTTDFHGSRGNNPSDFDLEFSLERWPERAPGVEMAELFPVQLTPACAPRLLEKTGPLNHPEQLAQFDILHETAMRNDWTTWIDAFAPGELSPFAGQVFTNLDLATRAAMMGAGFVMADLALCRDELASGALVAPFPDLVCDGPFGGVCLLGPSDRWDEPKVKTFRDWAENAAAKDTNLWSPR